MMTKKNRENEKERSIEAMKKAFKTYKRDRSGAKPLLTSMKEISTWLSSKEAKA